MKREYICMWYHYNLLPLNKYSILWTMLGKILIIMLIHYRPLLQPFQIWYTLLICITKRLQPSRRETRYSYQFYPSEKKLTLSKLYNVLSVLPWNILVHPAIVHCPPQHPWSKGDAVCHKEVGYTIFSNSYTTNNASPQLK